MSLIQHGAGKTFLPDQAHHIINDEIVPFQAQYLIAILQVEIDPASQHSF